MNHPSIGIFKILTYLLLPIGFLFGMLGVMMLVMALGNPQILLPLFLMICFAIYIFTSFRFTQLISAGLPLTQRLRDWMRVNGYVCVFMSLLFLLNAAAIFFLPEQKLVEMVQPTIDNMGNLAGGITAEQMVSKLQSFSFFLMAMSSFLLAHIVMNFRLQKIFSSSGNQSE